MVLLSIRTCKRYVALIKDTPFIYILYKNKKKDGKRIKYTQGVGYSENLQVGNVQLLHTICMGLVWGMRAAFTKQR